MSATTAEITVYVAPDSFDRADPQHNDIPASLDAYADELDAALAERFPEANITVVVAHGTTSAWDGDTDLSDDVHAIIATVFERGTFWQAQA